MDDGKSEYAMTTTQRTFTDAERMELRSYVQLAGEAIAHYWPMRTFIHHNPLHGLEELPFDQAVKRGERLLGGRGYLPGSEYRRYFAQGRIRIDDLTEALAPLATDKRVRFAGRELSHLEVLRLSMIHGLTEQESVPREPAASAGQSREHVRAWLAASSIDVRHGTEGPLALKEPVDLLSHQTLSAWCDETLGTSMVSIINEQMIKWCSAFLDEGEASWSMPYRDETFFRAWKKLAPHDVGLRFLGIKDAAGAIAALEDRADEALLRILADMKIPKPNWEAYLSLHLAALPGWTGYVKWRSEEVHHPWQIRYPVDLVKYLAVRLFYERELVAACCRASLGIDGHYDAIRGYMETAPFAWWLRREFVGGRLPAPSAKLVRSLASGAVPRPVQEWNTIGQQVHEDTAGWRAAASLKATAERLAALATAIDASTEAILETDPSEITTLLNWLDGFPPSQQGLRWLEAFEAHHRREVVEHLSRAVAEETEADRQPGARPDPRPLAQLVFCIDVRSEVLRRHLEQLGGYETFGLAGFFGIPLEYQPFGAEHTVAQCPVLLKPKNRIREIPRGYQGKAVARHRVVAQLTKTGHSLLHDLKGNVVTPYVMVEALGWLFGLPLLAKTLCPLWYARVKQWLKDLLVPPVATTLTIDKLTREEAEEILAADQRAQIREALRADEHLRDADLTPALIEAVRLRVLEEGDASVERQAVSRLGLAAAEEQALYDRVRRRLKLTPRGLSHRLDRITRNGLSVTEQAYGVEAALRLMGLTSGFSRLIALCAHGSTSDNNPYESALDCGACGGNHGLPNARAFAAMANRPGVRELLMNRGIKIPNDTHFVAAHHDTTSDEVRVADLEDVPPTHRKDLARLLADLQTAGIGAALERGAALESGTGGREARVAQTRAKRRSADWAQIRPEWGLSRNSLMVIGRRELTRTLSLQGRSFLHSYDHRQDASGRLLEAIMTAPLVVAQWINMEHYFSTVDNDVYGSGSKVYHNVVGRIGVMSGVSSDLRIGLPAQTVLDGTHPYHEPMRLLAVMEAPRERIRGIILKHPVLERLFDREWVSLLALDPVDRGFYRYDMMKGWEPVRGKPRGGADDRTPGRSSGPPSENRLPDMEAAVGV